MCIFLIMNISSLQLIPINMIAYRSQYGSANPAGIIVPAIMATFFSTLAEALKDWRSYWSLCILRQGIPQAGPGIKIG